MTQEHTPVEKMQAAINCLALEVPSVVYADIRRLWKNLLAEIDRLSEWQRDAQSEINTRIKRIIELESENKLINEPVTYKAIPSFGGYHDDYKCSGCGRIYSRYPPDVGDRCSGCGRPQVILQEKSK